MVLLDIFLLNLAAVIHAIIMFSLISSSVALIFFNIQASELGTATLARDGNGGLGSSGGWGRSTMGEVNETIIAEVVSESARAAADRG